MKIFYFILLFVFVAKENTSAYPQGVSKNTENSETTPDDAIDKNGLIPNDHGRYNLNVISLKPQPIDDTVKNDHGRYNLGESSDVRPRANNNNNNNVLNDTQVEKHPYDGGRFKLDDPLIRIEGIVISADGQIFPNGHGRFELDYEDVMKKLADMEVKIVEGVVISADGQAYPNGHGILFLEGYPDGLVVNGDGQAFPNGRGRLKLPDMDAEASESVVLGADGQRHPNGHGRLKLNKDRLSGPDEDEGTVMSASGETYPNGHGRYKFDKIPEYETK